MRESGVKYFCDCDQTGKNSWKVSNGRGKQKETQVNNDYCVYCGHVAFAQREKLEKIDMNDKFYAEPITIKY